MMNVVKHCNGLPRQVAIAPLLETFKISSDRALSNLIRSLLIAEQLIKLRSSM